VLVAKDGDVYVDRAFGIPAQPRDMPRSALPQFDVGDIARVFTELCAQMPAQAARARRGPPQSPLQECVTRVSTPIGAHQTAAADSQRVLSSVDELYRLALGLQDRTTWRNSDYTKGWASETVGGVRRFSAYATPDGKRAAFVRVPERQATVIVLTNDANADARGMAERILERLLVPQGTNPFAAPSTLPLHAPQFDRIGNADFEPGFAEGMRQETGEIAAITAETASPTFDNTIIPLEKSGQMLDRVQAVFGLLTQANTNDTLQRLRGVMAPRLAAHGDSINMNPVLFARVKAIYDKRHAMGLTAVQKELVERYYRNFVRAGAQLSDSDKARLRAINQESSKLSTEFARKVLSGTRDNALVVDSRAELDGLSEGEIAAAADAAQRRGLAGKYVIPLQNTTQQPAQASLNNRAVRQRLFELSVMRNNRGDSNDTKAIVQRLEQLREQRATLLGYKTYADYALENQMAKTPEAAIGLLSQLAPPATAKARVEAARMQRLIDKQKGGFKLAPWDWQYYTEQVRQADYDIDAAKVKQYLELDRVLKDGVFYAANKLYGITFRERHDLPVWQSDVRVFDVLDSSGTQLAIFYADYFKRDNKQGGAWMSSFVRQSGLLGDKPVVYNIANLPKPAPGEPALISFDDVHTMFHEFGHALQGMFSNVEYPTLAGTSVPRDFVEMPSQFNEHWATEPSVFANYARHYQSGAPMPANLVEKLKQSATFNQGFATTEYLAAALLDLAWHTRPADSPPADVNAFEQAALDRFKVNMRDVPPRYHTTYFSHIWSGGYAAAYYAYMWSELIDDDLYYWFKEHGGMTRANGNRFRDLVLSRGSTKPAGDLFRDFRGRDPVIEPLLLERGLKDVSKGREP
jgi:peptidyl-dipeptidase Dcp